MAGVKGRSGGARPGAGRKPKTKPEEVQTELEPQAHGGALKRNRLDPAAIPAVPDQDPLDFLLMVQNSPDAPLKDRIRAAVAAAQYKHMKTGDGGKREAAAAKAGQAAKGKYGVRPAPLKVVGGRG